MIKSLNNFFLALFMTVLFMGCSKYKSQSLKKFKTAEFNFNGCLLEEKDYESLSLDLIKGYEKEELVEHGFCEYRIIYPNSSILYVSTDIYSGSQLNYSNLNSIGIDTHAKSRSMELIDTLRYNGSTEDGKYWLEYVLGDFVVGYVGVADDDKSTFDQMIQSVEKIK